MLPDFAYTQLTPDLRVCRVLNGLWQVSGAHGAIDQTKAVSEMFAYHDAGFTTWDLADHYGPAEDLIGEFRRKLAAERVEGALKAMQAFTKWVPRPIPMTRKLVEEAINTARRRMNTETLDMVQFHWWEYRFPGYLPALRYMSELCDEGKIRHLGLTNFDTKRLEEITGNNIRIVSNQVQYSIIDRRPEVQMVEFCQKHNVALLTYGTVCGGLLSEKYLNQPEPHAGQLNTASLRKYKNMIDQWGAWTLFQELLVVLKAVADRHKVSIANVATRYILDKPAVAGVILGARLSIREHRDDNSRVFSFSLTPEDVEMIERVTQKSRDLFRIIGDCGDEYRR
jgi:aryl-alcohol dehydrogenase-like predicted oxidoreductase